MPHVNIYLDEEDFHTLRKLKGILKCRSNEELLKKILDTIGKFKNSEEWTKENGKYIPHPATWLNAKGWEDEFELPDNPYSHFEIVGAKKEPPKIECKFCGVVHLVKEDHQCK